MSSRKIFVISLLVLTVGTVLPAVVALGQQPAASAQQQQQAAQQPQEQAKADPNLPQTPPVPATPVVPSTGTSPTAPAAVRVVAPSTVSAGGATFVAAEPGVVTVQTVTKGKNAEVEAAMRKAEEELRKVESMLRDLEKGGAQAEVQKAREDMQNAMRKAREEMQKAKQQYEITAKEIRQVLPGPEPFGQALGYGGGTGGYQGSWAGGKEYAKAMEQWQKGQEEFGRLQGPFSTRRRIGTPFFGTPDPETQALAEKEDKLEQEVQGDVSQYKSADAATKATLKKHIAGIAGQQFDIRQQSRELEVKRLEAELARIRESIQKRNDNREQILKHHVAQLLHEEDDLEF
jgi:hypothetical protein